MRRFFAENADLNAECVTLSGDEARHIRNVLRMKQGDEVLLINGSGLEALARIADLGEHSVRLAIIDRQSGYADPDIRVTLFQCLPKQGKMELIIQKCVELGVWEIVPVISKRCIVKIDGKDNKLIRWNKVSAEASKQCGRAYVPAVTAPKALSSVDFSEFDLVLIPYENEDGTSLKQALRESQKVLRVALVIGPEGGFEPSEVESVISKGGRSVSLGKRILRTETAGMAAIAQIIYEFES